MEPDKARSDGGDPEDIPSDFFDDFAKDEFLNGLSVIDSWDDDDAHIRRKINVATLDSVKDLRELIGDKKNDEDVRPRSRSKCSDNQPDQLSTQIQGPNNDLDNYIKPGSRRDPNKRNEAIKKDKELKVKEYLAKHLESTDDIRPPGTELDEYFAEKRPIEKKKSPEVEESKLRYRRSRENQQRRRDPSPKHARSPRRYSRRSPKYASRQSPRRNNHRSPTRNVQYYTPPRRFRRFSPQRRSPHRSPSRKSPRNIHRSRTRSPLPFRRSYASRRSRSPLLKPRDNFLYPPNSNPFSAANTPYTMPNYSGQYPVDGHGYTYPQGPTYTGYTGMGYEYRAQPDVSVPLPVPAPAPEPLTAAGITQLPNMTVGPTPGMPMNSVMIPPMNTGPAMVPPPSQIATPSPLSATTNTNYDALAQLVAEGKLSKQDYFKLAPNKGVGNSNMDTKTRVMVLSRCNEALTKLGNLMLPTRLIMNSNIIGQEPKSLVPKYCSPLKRQAAVGFQFTRTSGTTVQQNKQLVDSIIATIGLNKVVSRPKKKTQKNMKDAAVQTTRPFCEMCEIRECTKINDASTSVNPEHFSTSVYSQVVEQDLISSKSVFNPTGGASGSSPMSIAHMTPAQLVSQLAARAKTLKQTDPIQTPNQFRRNIPNNRGQYHNYGYRY